MVSMSREGGEFKIFMVIMFKVYRLMMNHILRFLFFKDLKKLGALKHDQLL